MVRSATCNSSSSLAAAGFLSPGLISDVEATADETTELAAGRKLGRTLMVNPAELAIVPSQQIFQTERVFGLLGIEISRLAPLAVAGMHVLEPTMAQFLIHRASGEGQPAPITVGEPPIQRSSPDEHGADPPCGEISPRSPATRDGALLVGNIDDAAQIAGDVVVLIANRNRRAKDPVDLSLGSDVAILAAEFIAIGQQFGMPPRLPGGRLDEDIPPNGHPSRTPLACRSGVTSRD